MKARAMNTGERLGVTIGDERYPVHVRIPDNTGRAYCGAQLHMVRCSIPLARVLELASLWPVASVDCPKCVRVVEAVEADALAKFGGLPF